MSEKKSCRGAELSDSPLDPAAILAHLGVSDAQSIVPVQGGADSALWQVVRSESTYALRVLRADQADVGEREALAMQLAEAAGVPVPRVHRLAMWHGRPALLLSWCPGTTLGEFLPGRPWLIWAIGARFGHVLARLHTVPPPEPWCRADQDWLSDLGPEEAALQSRLRALSAGQERLLHLDYHPLNVMTDGREITGVLDWANAGIGDPRADLARTLTVLEFAGVATKAGRFRRSLLRLLELAFLSGYGRVAGPIRDLAPFRAWAWEFMARDQEPKMGRPGFWLQPWHLALMRQRATLWKRRAGIDPS
jgi:aminoglycoside phosphotransferase (APT) family kinase protein